MTKDKLPPARKARMISAWGLVSRTSAQAKRKLLLCTLVQKLASRNPIALEIPSSHESLFSKITDVLEQNGKHRSSFVKRPRRDWKQFWKTKTLAICYCNPRNRAKVKKFASDTAYIISPMEILRNIGVNGKAYSVDAKTSSINLASTCFVICHYWVYANNHISCVLIGWLEVFHLPYSKNFSFAFLKKKKITITECNFPAKQI